MGIKHLTQLIGEHAPKSMRESEIKQFFGRKVAIDASMSIYQFLIAVRQRDGQQLMSDTGETTSHLMGMFYRTLRIVDNGIKPVYVFDGKPPTLKSGELAKRYARRDEAAQAHEEALETGTVEEIDKFSRRTVRVTKEHNDECKRLLTLMGVPYVEAPCEAEAQCAALARAGKVYAAASEDMDTLCYEPKVLLRHLTFSEQRKMPISEIFMDQVLQELDMPIAQFIDMCILLGCDYCDPIKGVGPSTALKLIREHKNLENLLPVLKSGKYVVPDPWPYQDARELFTHPDVIPADDIDLKWQSPDTEGLVEFLVKEKGFNEDRVRSGASRLQKNLQTAQQGRLDSFFKVLDKSPGQTDAAKRKLQEKEYDARKKNKTAAGAKKGQRKAPRMAK